ncbi:hypothetical protein GJAV_G00167290 [Gymnothorax javanicus]|nr:hypothetical protein GJAV_G00167290 [Gymnothorax javanicus]
MSPFEPFCKCFFKLRREKLSRRDLHSWFPVPGRFEELDEILEEGEKHRRGFGVGRLPAGLLGAKEQPLLLGRCLPRCAGYRPWGGAEGQGCSFSIRL